MFNLFFTKYIDYNRTSLLQYECIKNSCISKEEIRFDSVKESLLQLLIQSLSYKIEIKTHIIKFGHIIDKKEIPVDVWFIDINGRGRVFIPKFEPFWSENMNMEEFNSVVEDYINYIGSIYNNIKKEYVVGKHFFDSCIYCGIPCLEDDIKNIHICSQCNGSKKPKRRGEPHNVYFIGVDEHPGIKIGITKDNPKKRLKELQIGNPFELNLLGMITTNGCKLEKELHKTFKEFSLTNEWFDVTLDVLKTHPKIQREYPVWF